MPSSTRMPPRALPCRCNDCREVRGRKRYVAGTSHNARPISVWPPVECFRRSDATAPPAESLPAPKNFFAKASFTQRLRSFMGKTIFGQVFVRGAMTKISKWKVPPTGGQSRGSTFRRTNGAGGSPLFIAPPLAGSLLAPLRCAGPCQSRCRATWQPSRYPRPSQAAFAPSVPSHCLSSAGRASRPEQPRA
jgi:hypothetical protein